MHVCTATNHDSFSVIHCSVCFTIYGIRPMLCYAVGLPEPTYTQRMRANCILSRMIPTVINMFISL